MRRFMLALATLALTAVAASAQPTLTSSPLIVSPGASATLTVTGTAGQSFAVIGSRTWSGFSYAGVDLAVGTDVTILGVGVLDGTGTGSITFTPPFPAQDRFYVQAVTSSNNFGTITATNRATLISSQEARLYMPIGGLVAANGTPVFLSPGLTVSKSGSVYTFNHPGMFEYGNPIPTVSVTGNATITSIVANFSQTVITLSNDGGIAITIQTVRR